jgi:hypothetical protein
MTKKKSKKKKKQQLPISNYDLKIKYVLDHFNFERVHDVMTATNWKWQHMDDPEDTSHRVPTIERMKRVATHLLYQVATEKEKIWGTGGFQARRFLSGQIELSFVVAETGTYDCDLPTIP